MKEKLRQYKVIITLDLADSDKKEQDSVGEDDESYIMTQIGWASEGFSGMEVSSIKLIKNRKLFKPDYKND